MGSRQNEERRRERVSRVVCDCGCVVELPGNGLGAPLCLLRLFLRAFRGTCVRLGRGRGSRTGKGHCLLDKNVGLYVRAVLKNDCNPRHSKVRNIGISFCLRVSPKTLIGVA